MSLLAAISASVPSVADASVTGQTRIASWAAWRTTVLSPCMAAICKASSLCALHRIQNGMCRGGMNGFPIHARIVREDKPNIIRDIATWKPEERVVPNVVPNTYTMEPWVGCLQPICAITRRCLLICFASYQRDWGRDSAN